MTITLYHNPRCTKSREALALLESKGVKTHIIEYLKTPLTAQEIRDLLDKLGLFAQDIIRTNEPEYKDLGLFNARYTEEGLIELLAKYPKLIQRPIAVNGNRAVIARPAEKLLEIL